MHILAIDTSTSCGGAALSCNDEILGLIMIKQPLRYSESLLEMIDFLLRQHSSGLEQIDLLAVATGPGSFTGVRIGLATVKGLAQGTGTPTVGISTLESLAFRFREVHPLVAPMIDARRNQVYGGLYQVGEEGARPRAEEQVLAPSRWLGNLPPEECVFVGDGAALHRGAILAARPQARVLETDNRVLESLCRLAHLRAGQHRTTDARTLGANYVRPPDIRR